MVGVVILVAYLLIGVYLARGAEFTDGSKGFESPMAILIAWFWPLVILYVAVEVASGSAKITWRGRK